MTLFATDHLNCSMMYQYMGCALCPELQFEFQSKEVELNQNITKYN